MAGLSFEPHETPSVRDFVSALSFATARLEFCERFDERSEIWNLSPHRHPFFELIFFVEGCANIVAGRDVVDVSGCDVVVYPPGLLHLEHLEIDRRQDIICLWVDAGPTPRFGHPITMMDSGGRIRQVFEQIYAEFTADRARRTELIQHYLEILLLLVQRHFEEPPRESNAVLERSLAYLHEHYLQDFTAEDLAAVVNVSPSQLFRLFRQRLGMGPIHYRNAIRIEKAKLMLLDRGLSVETVAERVGFADAKYFARVFRRATGHSPRDHRAQHARSRLTPAGGFENGPPSCGS